MNYFVYTISCISVTSSRLSSLQSLPHHGVLPSFNFLRKDRKLGNYSDMGKSLGDGGGYVPETLSVSTTEKGREKRMMNACFWSASFLYDTGKDPSKRMVLSGLAFPTQLIITDYIAKGHLPSESRPC